MGSVSLLAILDAAYDRKSWHGTNLRGSIRGVNVGQAAWRPTSKRHNIWELVVHCAYWKYTALRRLTGASRGSFALKGSNWFARQVLDETTWREDVALLERTRGDSRTELGASPRAGLMLLKAAKALAALSSRDHVLPDDVQELAVSVLSHRLLLAPEAAGVSRREIVEDALERVPAL